MGTEFNILMTQCRKAYAVFRQMANRTDDALYEALGQAHALRVKTQMNPTLHAEFGDLLQQHTGGKAINETLFLVKYAFFPDTLQPGPGHKADLNKASRYAKLINTAVDKGIKPEQFVAFARKQGIQRTAMSSRTKGRPRGKRGSSWAKRPPVQSHSFIAEILTPLETWLYSSAVAERLAAVMQSAKTSPQRLSLRVYVNHERAVLTGIVANPASEFPTGTIRISSRAQPRPPNARADPREHHQERPTGLPSRMRGTPVGTVNA